MFDTGLWLFVGLVALFVWRAFGWWKCCGTFLRFFNYVSLLLLLVFVILVYDCYEFCVGLSAKSSDTWDKIPGWLKVMVYVAPAVAWLTFGLGSHQVYQHILCIQEESAVLRHDRAVQIIVLPMVYGVMCLSCLIKCYAFLVNDDNLRTTEQMPLAVAQAETCLWIGDLYESWALYQFGVLSLEVMESSLKKMSHSEDQDERAASRALLVAHPAVVRLTWLGIMSFVLVSVADSAVALWYLTFGTGYPNLVSKFNSAEGQFDVAGFLASCAAIFNIYVVESQFHHFLEEFHPFLKFLTVKILVTFAYGQQYIFVILQMVYGMSPASAQGVMTHIPVLGWVMTCSQAEFYLFYSALLVVECLMIGLMHMWAWKDSELWYEQDDEDRLPFEATEKKAIMPGAALLYGSSGV